MRCSKLVQGDCTFAWAPMSDVANANDIHELTFTCACPADRL